MYACGKHAGHNGISNRKMLKNLAITKSPYGKNRRFFWYFLYEQMDTSKFSTQNLSNKLIVHIYHQ